MKFLIVDDNLEDRSLARRELQIAFPDAEFEEVFLKEDFVKAVVRGGFDLALTDYHLGWSDGLWVLSTIKARFPDMPVVMVTGTGSEEIAVAGMKAGLSDYVLKGHLRRLPVAVREGLEKARLSVERKQAEADLKQTVDRLQALSRRLVEVQESERRHVARELHDEIGQSLTGIHLLLRMSTCEPAYEAQEMVGELIARVRNLSLDLRPSMLDDLGLLPALLWHFDRYTAQTDISVTFRHAGLEGRRFEPEVETGAYRIVQEALTNVARHAGVREATVRLRADRDTLTVEVEDQGAGFDPEAALAARASSGLSGMRERSALLGGTLKVESAPGAGVRLQAELPAGAPGEKRGGSP